MFFFPLMIQLSRIVCEYLEDIICNNIGLFSLKGSCLHGAFFSVLAEQSKEKLQKNQILIDLHEDINVRIWLNICCLLSSRQLSQHLCNVLNLLSIPCNSKYKHRYELVNFSPTITCSNPLTSRRKGQRFTNCHFANVEIMLANISCCPLWYKLLHAMSIVGDLP